MKQIRANEQIKRQLPHTPKKKEGERDETEKIVPLKKSVVISRKNKDSVVK